MCVRALSIIPLSGNHVLEWCFQCDIFIRMLSQVMRICHLKDAGALNAGAMGVAVDSCGICGLQKGSKNQQHQRLSMSLGSGAVKSRSIRGSMLHPCATQGPVWVCTWDA